MSFLNKSMLNSVAADSLVEVHPLLKGEDVPRNVRLLYLQGCILAVLERDGGRVSPPSELELMAFGKSLQLSKEDVAESITMVSALNSEDAQRDFMFELKSLLSDSAYSRHFMADFERMIAQNGVLSEDARQTVDSIGMLLYGRKDWRAVPSTNVDQPVQKPTVASQGIQTSPSALDKLGKYFIDHSLCVECECCKNSCHKNAILRCVTGGLLVDLARCDNCGRCVSACPAQAIYEWGDYRINPELCVQCGSCVDTCPCEAIETCQTESGFSILIDPAKCVCCGVCEVQCPTEAIVSRKT